MMRRSLLGAASCLKSNAVTPEGLVSRGFAHTPGQPFTATLFPGDGIGPEIAESVKKVFSAVGASVQWDEQRVGTTADPRTNSFVSRENLDSVLVSLLHLLLESGTQSRFNIKQACCRNTGLDSRVPWRHPLAKATDPSISLCAKSCSCLQMYDHASAFQATRPGMTTSTWSPSEKTRRESTVDWSMKWCRE